MAPHDAGYDGLWLPGTNHAGIATHKVVERGLARKAEPVGLGREAFLSAHLEMEGGTGGILDPERGLGDSARLDGP